jgi:hypothetical protein
MARTSGRMSLPKTRLKVPKNKAEYFIVKSNQRGGWWRQLNIVDEND